MNEHRLPARVVPGPGEALPSYLARAAAANDLPAKHLWSGVGHGAKPPTLSELRRLSTLLGHPQSELLDMTVHRYRFKVTGGKRRDHGWRVDQHQWICPRCTPANGFVDRDWALALRPACLRCRVLLVPDKDAAREPVPVDGELLIQQRRLDRILQRSVQDGHSSSYLSGLRHLVLLTARTADQEWPRPSSDWERDLRRAAGTEPMRAWTTHAPQSPIVAAAVLIPCARAMHNGTRNDLIRQAWARLAQPGTAATAKELLSASVYLPVGATSERLFLAGRPRAGGRASGEVLRLLLHDLAALTRQGLAARHVPALCLDHDTPFLPPAHEIPARHYRAVALVAMLLAKSSDQRARIRTSWHHLHLPMIGGSTTLHHLQDGDALTPADADILLDFAEALAREGLIDYQERRERFRHITQVSSSVVDQLPAEAASHPHRRTAAAAWLWVHFARGSSLGFRGAGVTHEDLVRFDAALNPEGRLHLHEHGQLLLDGTLDLALPGQIATLPQRRASRAR